MYKGENTLESREQRADWIDVLKGIGIILVVIGHVNRGRKIFCVYGKNSSLIRNRYV